MKIKNKKGISLIALIITIAVLVILAGVTIQKGFQRTNEAKLAKHNTNISTTQEEVESYYYYQGGDLPVVDLTPYPISTVPTLLSEITKNGEQSDNFYVLDMNKLGKVSGKEGSGVGADIYIVSSTKHTVYYVRGTTVDGLVYHGLGIKSGGVVAQGGVSSPTSGPTSTPAATNTPGPTSTPTPTPVVVNSPQLVAGMTAVKWDGSTWVAADSANTANDWYNYSPSVNKWANAKLTDGSLFVWIPRYTYKIIIGEHTSIAGDINVKFSNGTTDDTSGGYRIHPAFYWGGWNIPISAAMTKQTVGGERELTGIWVAKFEASSNGGKIKIAPNAVSWRDINVNDVFTLCKNMDSDNATYGLSTTSESHMMKASEWGAVAYLSKYILGTTEVEINANSSYITANGDIVANKAESTTGTEYGIYDMSGCAYEYPAAYINNTDTCLTTYGNSLYTEAQRKYKDVFPKAATDDAVNDYAAASQAYGFALYETSSQTEGSFSWFGDFSNFPKNGSAFFQYGGRAANGTGAGLFSFSNYFGGPFSTLSFRPVLVGP